QCASMPRAANPFRFSAQSTGAASRSEWRSLARRCEDLGFSALHLADHFLGPGDVERVTRHPPQRFAPVPAMMVAAAATSTLKVGCRMFCVDYHVPAVLAK